MYNTTKEPHTGAVVYQVLKFFKFSTFSEVHKFFVMSLFFFPGLYKHYIITLLLILLIWIVAFFSTRDHFLACIDYIGVGIYFTVPDGSSEGYCSSTHFLPNVQRIHIYTRCCLPYLSLPETLPRKFSLREAATFDERSCRRTSWVKVDERRGCWTQRAIKKHPINRKRTEVEKTTDSAIKNRAMPEVGAISLPETPLV